MVTTDALDQLRQNLRKGQQTMADWSGGELAVSAVPGAGKSTGMAAAAAGSAAQSGGAPQEPSDTAIKDGKNSVLISDGRMRGCCGASGIGGKKKPARDRPRLARVDSRAINSPAGGQTPAPIST